MTLFLRIGSFDSFISVRYPLWFTILCLVAGIGYALLLYRKDKQTETLSPVLKKLLFILRAITVSIIAFLLLKPIVNTEGQYTEEATVLFLQDVSESVLSDTAKEKKFINELADLIAQLNNEFNLRTYSFGEYFRDSINFKFSDRQTNMSEPLKNVSSDWYNRNVGAIVLSGDGIFNAGSNPLYIAKQLNIPIYTLALGSPEAKRDLILKDAQYNKIVFLNDIYPLRVSVEAKKLKGQTTKLRIYDNGRLIHSEEVAISNNDFFSVRIAEAKAAEPGIHRIRFQLDALEGEYNVQNNRKDILFEVIDSKQKILILANSPHPDIAAIRRALKDNKNFEVDYAYISENTKPLSAYNLIVMHQLPSVQNSAMSELQRIRQNQIPVLWIIGKQSDISKLNTAINSMQITSKANSFDKVTGSLNTNFSLFELLPETQKITDNAPPLERPFADFSGIAKNEILFFAKIRDIETQSPLAGFFNVDGAVKNGLISGEGIWRWRIYDYKAHQNHLLFDEWIQKTCQYLSLKVDKQRFRVETKNIINDNSEVIFNAERYNKSYELINDEVVKLIVTDSTGAEYKYSFDKTDRAYRLNIGKPGPGDYKWKASTRIDNSPVTKTGEFSITELNTEARNTQANHQVLVNMAEQTGGKMLLFENRDELLPLLKGNNRIKPLIHTEKKTYNIIHAKWLFFLLLGLMTAEWLIRKYSGSY